MNFTVLGVNLYVGLLYIQLTVIYMSVSYSIVRFIVSWLKLKPVVLKERNKTIMTCNSVHYPTHILLLQAAI